MTIQQATLEDMPMVEKVHAECFLKDEHFTTLMGEGNNLTQKMYEAYLQAENLFLVAKDQDKIIGFCMGNMYNTKAMDIFYKNNTGTLLKRTLCLLIQGHPLVWKKVRDIVKTEWQKLKRKITKTPEPQITYLSDDINKPTASLLSICVLSECRGKGVSVALFQSYEQLLKTRGVKAFTLATWSGNTRGIAFYYKMGMRLRQHRGTYMQFIKDID